MVTSELAEFRTSSPLTRMGTVTAPLPGITLPATSAATWTLVDSLPVRRIAASPSLEIVRSQRCHWPRISVPAWIGTGFISSGKAIRAVARRTSFPTVGSEVQMSSRLL